MNFRLWTAVAICLFGAGMALGLTVRGTAADFMIQEIDALRDLSAMLVPFKVSTAAFIFLKNIVTLLLSFLFSPVFCLMPILALTLNGWLLSVVAVLVAQQESLGFVLAAIVPHGIFEIPALIIGEAAALSSGASVMMAAISAEKRKSLLPALKRNFRYLTLAAILLVPAAVIETFITPLFLR